MKKKLLWALLAIAVIVILILALALPRDDRGDKAAESVETQAEPTAEQPVEAAAQQTAEPETVRFSLPPPASRKKLHPQRIPPPAWSWMKTSFLWTRLESAPASNCSNKRKNLPFYGRFFALSGCFPLRFPEDCCKIEKKGKGVPV